MANVITAKAIVLPSFSLTETCGEGDFGAIKRAIPAVGENPAKSYYIRSIAAEIDAGRKNSPMWIRQQFNWLPLVLDRDSQPWDVAVVYILARLQQVSIQNTTRG